MNTVRVLCIIDSPFYGSKIVTSGMIQYIDPMFQCDMRYNLHWSRNYVAGDDQYDIFFVQCLNDQLKDIERLKRKNKYSKFVGGIRGYHGLATASPYLRSLDAVNSDNLVLLKMVKELHDNVHLCYSGVDAEQFHKMTVDRDPNFTVLFVGGMGKKQKNAQLVPQLNLPFKVATTPHWAKHYSWASYYPYDLMPKFYNSGDVLVMPSYSEGCPRAAFEAAACELPVIASKASGAAIEMLNEEQLVNDPDDLTTFRKKCLWLKDDPEYRAELGRRNRQKVLETWDWKNNVAEQYNKFFRSVLS